MFHWMNFMHKPWKLVKLKNSCDTPGKSRGPPLEDHYPKQLHITGPYPIRIGILIVAAALLQEMVVFILRATCDVRFSVSICRSWNRNRSPLIGSSSCLRTWVRFSTEAGNRALNRTNRTPLASFISWWTSDVHFKTPPHRLVIQPVNRWNYQSPAETIQLMNCLEVYVCRVLRSFRIKTFKTICYRHLKVVEP